MSRKTTDEVSMSSVGSMSSKTTERGSVSTRLAWGSSDVACTIASCCCKSDLLQLRATRKFLTSATQVQLVFWLVQSEDSTIAISSMKILPRIVRKGDPAAVSVVLSRLVDYELLVRKNALAILEEICIPGDTSSSIGFAGRIADPDPTVRNSAVTALVRTATKGDEAVMETVRVLLEHEDVAIRCRALDAIGDVALKCDASTVSLVAAQLEAHHSAQRCCAIAALGKIASGGGTLYPVVERLHHSDPGVCQAAAVALGKAVSRGNHPAAVLALTSYLGDKDVRDVRLRQAIAVALGKLAEIDDPVVIDALATCIDDDSCLGAQRRAFRALGEICSNRNSAIIPIASKCLTRHCDVSLRRTALEVVGKVFRMRDECFGQAVENRRIALALVEKHLQDESAMVQSAALAAAGNLRGDFAPIQEEVGNIQCSLAPVVLSTIVAREPSQACQHLNVIFEIRNYCRNPGMLNVSA